MRHSIPEKVDVATQWIPLSNEGRMRAKKRIHNADKCFSSPYMRALETAQLMFDHVEIVEDLREREIGLACEDFWEKQYSDYDYKNEKGESLNEVKIRMSKAIDVVLSQILENQRALVVSHATAICSYLLSFCEIEVIDSKDKLRRITYNGKEVMMGKIEPLDYFVIRYEDDEIESISFCHA